MFVYSNFRVKNTCAVQLTYNLIVLLFQIQEKQQKDSWACLKQAVNVYLDTNHRTKWRRF